MRLVPILAVPACGVLAAATMAAAAPAPVAPRPAIAFAALSPLEQARRLQPLRELADALAAVGQDRFAAGYSGVRIDAGGGTTTVVATSAAAARAIVRSARTARPGLSWARARVATARLSRAALDSAAARYVHGRHPAGLVSVGVRTDHLVVGLRTTAAPRAAARSTGGIPISFRLGQRPPVAKSWAAVKWSDRAPFIGGDVLTSDGHRYCTAGIPAVRRSDGHPVLLTAAHCFGIGVKVYTGAGTPGVYGTGRVGSYVGTVTKKILQWDAEEIDGTANRADLSGTSTWRPMTSAAYSWDGDYVCQAGQASFYLGHPTPCGIKVTDDDLWFKMGSYMVRGVEGVDVRHGWGSHNGDSGGTVFAVEPNGARQARGMVSAGGADGTADQKRVDWPEAVDMLSGFRLKLNPRT